MYNVDKKLRAFYSAEVTIDNKTRGVLRDARKANESRLKTGLEKGGRKTFKRHVKQGGYAMKTVVQQPKNKYDVDNGVVFSPDALLNGNGAELSPLEVRKVVCNALQDDKFTTPPQVRRHCVRVYYNDGYWVDVPVYREIVSPSETYLEIASTDWKRSDPAGVTAWFRDVESRSNDKGLSGDPQIRRIVAYIKGLAKTRESWNWPTGFMVSVLVEECYRGDDRDDVTLRETLTAIRDRLKYNTAVRHPKFPLERLDRGDASSEDARCVEMRDKLTSLLPALDVLDASGCTAEEADKAWDTLYSTTWFRDQRTNKAAESGAFGAFATGVPGKFERGDGGGRYG